jgi:hypothetical protein
MASALSGKGGFELRGVVKPLAFVLTRVEQFRFFLFSFE